MPPPPHDLCQTECAPHGHRGSALRLMRGNPVSPELHVLRLSLPKFVHSFTHVLYVLLCPHQFKPIEIRHAAFLRNDIPGTAKGIAEIAIARSDNAANKLSVVGIVEKADHLARHGPRGATSTIARDHQNVGVVYPDSFPLIKRDTYRRQPDALNKAERVFRAAGEVDQPTHALAAWAARRLIMSGRKPDQLVSPATTTGSWRKPCARRVSAASGCRSMFTISKATPRLSIARFVAWH